VLEGRGAAGDEGVIGDPADGAGALSSSSCLVRIQFRGTTDLNHLNGANAVHILAASLKQVNAMHAFAPTELAGSEGAFVPVERIEGALDAGAIVICDHASNGLPAEYGDLGLSRPSLERHIAYDIGAAWLTRRLAHLLGAPAVLSTFSRLLIDPNRGADDPTLVMRLSDGAIVPGNAHVDADEIERRRLRYWTPYRDAVARTVDAMCATGRAPAIISMHSFTPIWRGAARPWKVGVLWDRDPRLAFPLLQALAAESDLAPAHETVGDNEPYDGALEGDTIDDIATVRGLANALIEVRQDLIATEPGARDWAERLHRLLTPILARRELHDQERFGSRAGGKARHSPVRRG
jgi:predicted N-formylglutamate amidohydrolase